MKCKSCGVQLSPKFAAAIGENKCPACGKRMMTEVHYKKIFNIAEQISDLGFDDDALIGIAAAIASKFTLVPKGLGLEEDEDGNEIEIELEAEPVKKKHSSKFGGLREKFQKKGSVEGMSSTALRKLQAARKLDNDDSDEDDDDLSPQQRDQIVREYGLNVAASDNAPLSVGRFSGDSELMDAVANMPMSGDGNPKDALPSRAGSSAASAQHAALLARAEEAKNDPSKFRVRRADS